MRTRLLWRLGLAALLLVGAAGASAFFEAGRFLAREDPLQPADAIFVFAGSRAERPLEAADLYLAGYAPRIVLTKAVLEEAAVREAERRGAVVPNDLDVHRALLVSVGVPAEAVLVTETVHDNTADEARTLRSLALAHGWTRVILVTSRYHLRRAALASRRALQGTAVTVIRRGTRYDRSTPDRWWRSRADIRWLVSEIPRVVAYAVGLGG